MGLLDEAKAESAKRKYQPCTVALLDPELIAEINEALADPSVTAAALERLLDRHEVRADGRPVKAHTLRRHRAGDCTCVPS